MAQIKQILFYQWKTYFRSISIKRKTHRRFFFIIFLYLPFLIFPFFRFLNETREDIIRGNFETYQILLLGIIIYWLLLPMMAREIYLNLPIQKLRLFPVSNINLFIIRNCGTFIQPISWIGITGLFSLFYLSFFTGDTIFFSMMSILLTGVLFQMAIFISLISTRIHKYFMVLFFLLLIYFGQKIDITTLTTLKLKDFFLLNLLNIFTVRNYMFISILFACLGLLIILNYYIFTKIKAINPALKKSKIIFPFTVRIPGKYGGLIKKDTFYLFKNRNYFINIFITLLYFKYLFLDNHPSAYAAFVLLFFLFIPAGSFALNIFGLDRSEGIERYVIFPLRGHQILLTKNISFFFFLMILLSPFFAATLLKFGFSVFLFGFIQGIIMILLQVTIGNYFSILNPEKFEFFRFNFGSMHMGFPLVFVYYLTYIETIRSVGVFRDTNGAGIPKQLIFLAIYFLIYILFLFINGRKLDSEIKYIKDRLK